MTDLTGLKQSWAGRTSRRWHRMFRYTAGSAICFGVSELVFVLLFAPHLLGARGSSIVASIAGIIPGYFLNRNWTWDRRGRSDFWREVVPYWATAVISTVLAAVVTGAVNDAFINESRATRTVLNATAYMVTYGFIFVAKFVLFERVLFPGASPPDIAADAAPTVALPDHEPPDDDERLAASRAGDRVARGYTS